MLKVLSGFVLRTAGGEEVERWVRAHGTYQQVTLRSHSS